jgi:hypothetical protein
MSEEKCEGVGLAQDDHKYVKVPRVRARSRPTHIYRRTPLNRAVIPKRGVTRRVRRQETTTDIHEVTTCPA